MDAGDVVFAVVMAAVAAVSVVTIVVLMNEPRERRDTMRFEAKMVSDDPKRGLLLRFGYRLRSESFHADYFCVRPYQTSSCRGSWMQHIIIDPIDFSDRGLLLQVFFHTRNGIRGELRAVVVTNSTAEPDGSFRHYLLVVPPIVTSAREAVAWSFGLESGQYRPIRET